MNVEADSKLEELLASLRLCAPSESLDARIANIAGAVERANDSRVASTDVVSLTESRFLSASGFGWKALVITALAATLFGVLIGHAIPFETEKSVRKVVSSANATSQLIPVRFNPSAFDLLHEHSTNDEYSKCTDCHVKVGDDANQTLDVYRNWFYGDANWFKTHAKFKNQSCFDCHTFKFDVKRDWHSRTLNEHEQRCVDCHESVP